MTHILCMTAKRKRKANQKKAQKPVFSKALLAQAAEMVARGERLPLKDDVSFKLFLSAPTPESNACLRYFLSAMTGREVKKAKVTNSEVLPEYRKGKMPRMDVNCEFNDGQKADIELQLTKANDDQKLRSLYYACKLYAGSLGRGEKYKSAPNVYQIFLIDFDLFEDGEFYHRAMMRLDDGKILADRAGPSDGKKQKSFPGGAVPTFRLRPAREGAPYPASHVSAGRARTVRPHTRAFFSLFFPQSCKFYISHAYK